jgi:hypothetical protein
MRAIPGLANSKSIVPRTTPPFDSVFFTRLIGIFFFGSGFTIAWLHLASRKGAVAIESGFSLGNAQVDDQRRRDYIGQMKTTYIPHTFGEDVDRKLRSRRGWLTAGVASSISWPSFGMDGSSAPVHPATRTPIMLSAPISSMAPQRCRSAMPPSHQQPALRPLGELPPRPAMARPIAAG